MTITIKKIKKAKDFQVQIVISNDATHQYVSGWIDIVNLQDFETKLASATDQQILNALQASYETVIRTI